MTIPESQPAKNIENFKNIKFTVDSTLLRELGERLVGQPHIALAELVKNGYDADATKVEIEVSSDTITINDNGHGMDFNEFEGFWMRVGSPHKQTDEHRYSRNFQRPVTGSKGVGRLAVQFLASEIEMHTVSEKDPDIEIEVHIDWATAVSAGELTAATAQYRIVDRSLSFPESRPHGTTIILRTLNQVWNEESNRKLAQEIWFLQPPFRRSSELTDQLKIAFLVELITPDPDARREFEEQMNAVFDIWNAKLSGKLIPEANGEECKIVLAFEFRGQEKETHEYKVRGCELLHFLEFEIRFHKLRGRQEHGIIVDKARQYFQDYGGVHVYDSGFHLPFYGTPVGDWLRIQYDHAMRRHVSQLLPDELQFPRGLTFLPTLSRMFGVVHVNTSLEERLAKKKQVTDKDKKAPDFLQISVTRDRLLDNDAYQSLSRVIRYAVDFYAMREAARQYQLFEEIREIEPIPKKIERVEDVLELYRNELPGPVYRDLSHGIKDAIRASEIEDEIITRQAGLLGALATTGMAALAYEHEAKKQYYILTEIVRKLERFPIPNSLYEKHIKEIIAELYSWLNRSRSTRALFTTLLDKENREMVERFRASTLIRDVSDQLGILLRGVRPNTKRVDTSLRLPRAGYAEWMAVFHNILLNAVNAMLDVDVKQIDISSHSKGNIQTILIQDTGIGVDLATSEELFKPFVRRLEISTDRKALGLGGSGLGLTIVRMITNNIGCSASFVKPEKGFRTAIQIRWREG